MATMIGDILLSRYQITRVLGGGGFSDTYLAQDLALPSHPPCVVKHLRPKERRAGILQVAQELFEREATALYKLGENDLIPALYAHFEQDHEFFLVQEYIEGHDLAEEFANHSAWTEQAVIQLLIDILKPLSILHQEKFIHRDIKPQNLRRRDQDGKILLIDFGAVKEIQGLTLLPSGETSRTIAVGSPGYMPSEQLAGRPRLASDIYAVGMIGIQALTGHAPGHFEEDPVTGELRWHHETPVSSALTALLQKMVHPYHLNRFGNAQAALEAIRGIANQKGQSVDITTVAQVPQPSPESHPRPQAIASSASAPRGWLATVQRVVLLGGLLAITFTAGAVYRPLLARFTGPTIDRSNRWQRPSPVQAVEDYYQGINERRLGSTWKKLTDDQQTRGGGFRSYLEWWSSVDAVHVRDIELEAESDAEAQVRADLWYGMKDGTTNQELKNLITLKWSVEAGDWLIHRVE